MAAYTAPAKKWDVFISYARVAEPQWVEAFIGELQTHLDRELHQTGAAAIFWDQRDIAEQVGLTPEIVQALDSCATMVLVLSDAYGDRPWCRKECSHFARLCGEGSRRMFVVSIEDVPLEEQPAEVVQAELLSFKFWEPVPESKKRDVTRPLPRQGDSFDARIRELAKGLAGRLKEMKPEPTAPVDTAPLRHCTLFLADGETGHPLVKQLEIDRMTVRTSFLELGATVAPQTAGSLYELFYADRAACQAEVERLLGQSTLFLQLLGKKWDTDRYEAWLVERALAVGKRYDRDLILWRPQSLDCASITDPDHRAFVGSERVIANELVNELLPLLRRQALAIEADRKLPDPVPVAVAPGEPPARRGLILVDAAEVDQPLSEQLLRELERSGAGYHSAFDDLDEFQRMTASEKVDGIALVFGQCDAGWAHQRFRATRPHWLNKHPRPRIAVYRGDRQRPLPTNTDAITIIHADQPAEVQQFADRVREVAP